MWSLSMHILYLFLVVRGFTTYKIPIILCCVTCFVSWFNLVSIYVLLYCYFKFMIHYEIDNANMITITITMQQSLLHLIHLFLPVPLIEHYGTNRSIVAMIITSGGGRGLAGAPTPARKCFSQPFPCKY